MTPETEVWNRKSGNLALLATVGALLLWTGAAQAKSKSTPAPMVEPPPAAAASITVTTPAAAATPPVKDDAPSHVARARELFQEQKFGEAGDQLQRAYALEPKPLFLFNAGQAYRKAERRKDALAMYDRYLSVAADGPLAAEARGYQTDLQALLKAEQNMQDVNLRLENEKSRTEALEESLKKERKRPVYKHPAFIVGITVLGVGVLTVGLGFIGAAAAARTDLGQRKFTFTPALPPMER